MEATDNILISVKKMLGIESEYTHFDADLIMHINSVFSILTQMGVGPNSGFAIESGTEEWSQFTNCDTECLIIVKTYMYMKVRLMFDPPLSSAAVDSLNRQIGELEWRLFVAADNSATTEGDEIQNE